MSENNIKGIRHFHVCSMGSCKNGGMYQTKNGETYCRKCVIRYVSEYGTIDFWPHFLEEIVDIYNKKILSDRARLAEKELERGSENEECN